MSIENAKRKLGEAIYALKLAQVGAGRGEGAREVALAVTNAEQAEAWLLAAEKVRKGHEDSGPITSDGGMSGNASESVT